MEDIPRSKEIEFREAFEVYDKDRDGFLTLKELSQVLRSINSDFTQSQIESIVAEADTSGTGKLNLNDFISLMASKYRESETDEEVINAFRVFDKDGTGVVAANELRHIMTTLGDKLTDEEVDEMIREADINGDGFIYYEDFVRTMMAK